MATITTITADHVRELYRSVNPEAVLIEYAGGAILSNKTSARDRGEVEICDYAGLVELDHSGEPVDGWNDETFQLVAEVLNAHEPDRVRAVGARDERFISAVSLLEALHAEDAAEESA